jgi:hypothetical protein
MKFQHLSTAFFIARGVQASFAPVKTYAGDSFFDDWDYYGNVDDTTHGASTFLCYFYVFYKLIAC